MQKYSDGNETKFKSADEMVRKAGQPEGDYKVAPCNAEVEESLNSHETITVLVLGLIAYFLLLDVLYYVIAIPVRIAERLAGLIREPEVIVLHNGKISVITGVTYEKNAETYQYDSVYHFPTDSVKQQSFPTIFGPGFRFKTRENGALVTLRSSRKTKKQKIYRKNVIGLGEMEKFLFQKR